jgi:hypothetical protein
MSKDVLSPELQPQIAIPPVDNVVSPVEITFGEPSRLRRLLARGGTALALAGTALGLVGCTHDTGSEEKQTAYASPVKDEVSRSVAESQFDTALAASPVDTSIENLIPRVSAGNKAIEERMRRAVDAKIADSILGGLDTNTGQPFNQVTAVPLDKISDAKLRARVTSGLFIYETNQAVNAVYEGQTEHTIDEVRQEIAKNTPSGAEEYYQDGSEALDAVYAGRLVDEMNDGAREVEARANVKHIKDTAIRTAAQRAIDLKDAQDVLERAPSYDFSEDAAKADLADVVNINIREKALAALRANARGDYETVSDAAYAMESEEQELENAFDPNATKLSGDVQDVDNFQRNITTNDVYTASNDIAILLGHDFARASGIRPAPAEINKPLPNPDEIVDLRGVHAKTDAPNSYRLTASEDQRAQEPETFAQFGEVYAQDGKLTFKLQDGLDPNLVSQFKQAYEQVLPIMEAGFASGEVLAVHLITGDTFNPYYAPSTREIYMLLGSGNTMTMDRLVSAWRHELLHGISRDAMSDIGVTEKQKLGFATACNNLKSTAYSKFEQSLAQDSTLQALHDAAYPEEQPIIDTLIKAVETHTLAEILQSTPEELKSDTMSVNQCDHAGNVSLLMYRLAQRTSAAAQKVPLDSLYSTDAFKDFSKKWAETINYLSNYNEINESSYVTEADQDGVDLGHSEDNDAEMFASIMDAAISWPDKFRDNLQTLSSEDQKAILDMLGQCTNLMAQHESLLPLIVRLRTEYHLVRP